MLATRQNDGHLDVESGVETLSIISDQSSIVHEPPQQRRRGHPATASRRRASAMMYAEKYGLNSSSPHDDLQDSNDDSSEDNRPLSYIPPHPAPHTPPQQQHQQQPLNGGQRQRPSTFFQQFSTPVSTSMTSLARPISVRNIAEATNSARPARFVKPAMQQARAAPVPSDMQHVQRLYEHYHRKVYMEGYLFKKNDLTTEGKPTGDDAWSRWYVELCGPVLTLWDAERDDDGENMLPQYINVTDSYIETVQLQPEYPPREHVFSLNSAGANRYLLHAPDLASLTLWMCAIRLSCYECSRIHEIYTRCFVTRSTYSDILSKHPPKTEGWLQVRFPGATDWQKYWAVVTDRREEKKLFGKKSVPSRGQLMFYESKKAKSPVMTIVNVVQAYTIYPESPQLIDLASLMKVEGNLYSVIGGEQRLYRAASSTLVMAANAKELVQWLAGTFDAFKLYGRPSKLLNDSKNMNALNFGEPTVGIEQPRLFLETQDVAQVNVFDDTLVDNKAAFTSILHGKLKLLEPAPAAPTHSIGNRTNSMPLLSGLAGPVHAPLPAARKRTMSSSMLSQPPSPLPLEPSRSSSYLANLAAGQGQTRNPRPHSTMMLSQKPVYASDDSDDDEEEDEEEDESDDDSVFYKKEAPKQDKGKAEVISPPTISNATPPTTATVIEPPQRRPSNMTLPEITESTDDFANSIFGNVTEKEESAPAANASEKPTPLKSAYDRAVTSSKSSSASSLASTPLTGPKQSNVAAMATRPNERNGSSASLTTSEESLPKAKTAPSRPGSSMGWKRSSSAIMMQTQPSLSGSGSSSIGQSSVHSITASESESSFSNPQPVYQQRPGAERRSTGGSMIYGSSSHLGGRRSSSALLSQYQQQQHQLQQPSSPQWDMRSDGSRQDYFHPPQSPSYRHHHEQQQYYDPQHPTGEYDDEDDAPIVPIPQLGEQFATQYSLLDMYRPDMPSARDQEDYARATGQPLVSIPGKPSQPRAGLVGMISQLENDKKEREAGKARMMMERNRESFYGHPLSASSSSGSIHPRQPFMYSPQQQQPPPPPPQQPMQPMMGPYGMMMGPAPMMDPRMSMMMPPGGTPPPHMLQPGMMDPRMSMMPNMAMMYMMQGSYGQMPMYPMFYNPMMQSPPPAPSHGKTEEEEEDDDDDVPLGAASPPAVSPQPRASMSTSTARQSTSMPRHQRQRSHGNYF
ncbi:hypothetical protein BCR43DRAFT_489148 [Syncephalastrum racemosum]|uniref:PH domain-containing protein n=1 Tax=Syncephalastrum racemosum TaxID=13706 RepID=A0A1X2HJX9_SYNRA|nr:hypothetical protein BCR43DRAFT_489148 [Syncephalastrum racemosum]